jgi:hypothetical protein
MFTAFDEVNLTPSSTEGSPEPAAQKPFESEGNTPQLSDPVLPVVVVDYSPAPIGLVAFAAATGSASVTSGASAAARRWSRFDIALLLRVGPIS